VTGGPGWLRYASDWALGTGHTRAGGPCADAVQAGFGADGPARILHMDTGSRGLGPAKSWTELPT